MPAQHSVEGYLNLLAKRSKRTVLVEGITDWRVLCRITHELSRSGSLAEDSVLVDRADIIRAPAGVEGNRAVVEYVFGRAAQAGLPLAALVDREFRRFGLEIVPVDELGAHVSEGDICSWTRGHSLENYFFEAEVLGAYLRFSSPEKLSAAAIARIVGGLPSVLRWASAISVAAQRHGQIGRLEGVVRHGHWSWDGKGEPELHVAAVAAELERRDVDPATAAEFSRRVRDTYSGIGGNLGICRWLAHGHLGCEHIWSFVAFVASEHGVAGEPLNQLEHGHVDAKLQFAADYWAQRAVDGREESPTQLWDWMRRPR